MMNVARKSRSQYCIKTSSLKERRCVTKYLCKIASIIKSLHSLNALSRNLYKSNCRSVSFSSFDICNEIRFLSNCCIWLQLSLSAMNTDECFIFLNCVILLSSGFVLSY